jgi:hypothetical protein
MGEQCHRTTDHGPGSRAAQRGNPRKSQAPRTTGPLPQAQVREIRARALDRHQQGQNGRPGLCVSRLRAKCLSVFTFFGAFTCFFSLFSALTSRLQGRSARPRVNTPSAIHAVQTCCVAVCCREGGVLLEIGPWRPSLTQGCGVNTGVAGMLHRGPRGNTGQYRAVHQ